MRIALIAPPFIAVPPQKYGGTELFVAVLANALHAGGHDVVVYANGDSHVNCELRWRYRQARWRAAEARRRSAADVPRLLGIAGPAAHRRPQRRICRRSGLRFEERPVIARAGVPFPDRLGRTVRPRDDRIDGVRHAGAGAA